MSIVRLVQSTIPVSNDSHSHSSPLCHLPGELVSISSVPIPSIDLNLWNRSRPSAFVPISLGFTPVLTDDIVSSLCCCLLSRVSGMIVQSLSVWLVRKSTQLTVHQEHTVLILHWIKQQSPVLDIHSSGGIDQRNTVCKMCFSSSLGHRPSQHQNIP